MKNKSPLQISQVKYGAILSYILIVVNSLQGMFLAPYILSRIGEGDYGVYKAIASFSSTIMVLDLGIGTTVMRYTAKFRAENKKGEIENFAAMGLIEAGIMAVVVLAVSVGIYFSLPSFYAETYTAGQVLLARKLFAILTVNMVLVVLENVLGGVITGSNHFVFANGLKLGLLILRIIATVALLQCWESAMIIVGCTLACSVITMGMQLYYIRAKLKIRIRLKRWDNTLFRESFGYTALMFIQTIAIQANGNVDNIVISSVIGPAAVTVYSFGIQLFNMYESLATAFSNLMLPNISKQISDGASDSELQQTVTRVGRMQFLLLGAALTGFICVGRDFIRLWLGEGYEDVYSLSLIMMVPVTFTLIQNVCLSILRAKNMMKFRTGCLIFMAVFNTVITIVGTKLFGYYAAAIGTSLSVLVGSVVLMNVYYHKKIGFRVFKFYWDVFKRLLLCILVPGAVTVLLSLVCPTSWLWLLLQVGAFVVIYVALLWLYGLTDQEKRYFFKVRRKK